MYTVVLVRTLAEMYEDQEGLPKLYHDMSVCVHHGQAIHKIWTRGPCPEAPDKSAVSGRPTAQPHSPHVGRLITSGPALKYDLLHFFFWGGGGSQCCTYIIQGSIRPKTRTRQK